MISYSNKFYSELEHLIENDGVLLLKWSGEDSKKSEM